MPKSLLNGRADRGRSESSDLTIPISPEPGRWSGRLQITAFVFLTSVIVVMASERVYWYWAGFDAESVLVMGAFYLVPAMAGLWAMALAPARRPSHVVLAGAIFAFVVEGVLTPIVYLDGPLPVMAMMFTGWHGLVAFAGFWYLIRRWLVDRRSLQLICGSVAFGAVWGVWAVAAALSDAILEDEASDFGFDPALYDPAEFALYAGLVVSTLAVAHWLIGYVWPTGWRPGKKSTVALFVIAGLYMSVAVLPAVIWAPLKLAALIGGTWKLLRRADSGEHAPSILDGLAGRVRIRDVVLVLPMAASAALTYGLLWQLRDNGGLFDGIYGGLVAIQILAGGGAFVWAWRSVRRASR